jgi:hypothetical protein
MRFWLTFAALLWLLSLAYRHGGQPEKLAAIAYVTAFMIVPIIRLISGPGTFESFDLVLFVVEMLILIIVFCIALKANRLWPLFSAALQLFVVSAHVAKLIELKGMIGVYWGMTTIPTYLQFVLLYISVRMHSIRLRQRGLYPDWDTR